MTKPRRHIAGQIALLTRRCSERRYFLRPDDYINRVAPFEVGKAANKHGQAVYAAVAMSNHVHFGVGDTTGERSKFMQDSMSGIARARNCDLKRRGHFWEAGSYGDTVLLDKDAIERKLLYIWLNPVRAGLVERAEDWPGFIILPRDWGETITIDKPGKFYGRKNPDVVEFVPQRPPGYDDMSLQEVKEHFENLLRTAEDEIAELRREQGMTCRGARAVEKVDPFSSPDTDTPFRKINPRFATRDGEVMASAKADYRAFCDRYETQRQRWINSSKKSAKRKKEILFPCGTVWMKRCTPVKCKAPAPDEPGLLARA